MAREKKSEDAAATTVPENGHEEIMEVKMRGPASKVMDRLSEKQEPAEKAEPAPPLTVDEEFVKALQNPNNILTVRRISPRFGPNREKINVEVWRVECPVTLQDVHDELVTNHGGQKYRLGISDRDSGSNGPAMRYEIDADPIIPEPDKADAQMEEFFSNQGEKSSSDMTVDVLEREAKLAAKQFEIETNRARLRDLRESMTAPRPLAAPSPAVSEIFELRTKLAETERKGAEAIQQAKLEMLQREINALKTTPSRSADEPIIKMMMDQQRLMMDQQRRSDERFERMMEQMNANKIDAIHRELKEMRSAPAQNENSITNRIVEKALDSFLDEEDGDKEPKEWWEKALDRYVPEILDVFKEKKKSGKELTREEYLAEINKAADRAAAEEIARVRAEQAGIGHAPVPTLPPPLIQTTGPVPAPVAAQLPAPLVDRAAPSVEDEIKLRVANVLEALRRESVVRPREWEWTSAAWEMLPEEILEAVAKSGSPDVAISALGVHVDRKESILEFTAQVMADPKKKAFIEKGLAELSEWWGKSAADPKWSPFDEEGGE